MSHDQSELQAEKRRVERVVGLLGRRIQALDERLGGLREEVVEFRKHFWDDVTIDPNEPLESAVSMIQQAKVLAEREQMHKLDFTLRTVYRKLLDSPYFGRIDFREEGSETGEPVYIGIGSLPDETGVNHMIYDWRSPISSLYYDASIGPAAYDTPSGEVRGSVELKRQFDIRYGAIRSMFDTDLTIGDELLKEALSSEADSRMKNIVATIQREQNRFIRSDSNRFLIVAGPAGSGKTSAALQRIAYLLYKYRGSIAADQIVLFTPNPMFNRYIATVLPDLGEENMEQATFPQYLEYRLSGLLTVESPYEQLEYSLSPASGDEHETRMQGIAFKSSASFIQVIDRYRQTLEQSGLVFRDIRFRDRVLVPADAMAERFYASGIGGKLPPRIGRLVEWLKAEVKDTMLRERDEAWVEEEAELLGPEAQRIVYKRLQQELKKRAAFNERRREAELMREYVVHRYLKKLLLRIESLRFLDLPATYAELFRDSKTVRGLNDGAVMPPLWTEICKQTLDSLESGRLRYEDATPFLYMKERIEGFRVNLNVRYVLIDEAQDYSPFQLTYLRQLFPRARFTVLGDPNQSIHAPAALSGFDELIGLFGTEDTELIRFHRTYRSTRQIVEFTRSMLADAPEIEPFDRNGAMPTVTAAGSPSELCGLIAGKLKELHETSVSSIAVICKTAEDSREAHAALQERSGLPMLLIDRENASFDKGIVVIPSYLAKGIEFDAVLIHDASAAKYGRESESKLLYTACTRAMHRLDVYFAGEPSPFLAAAASETSVT